MKHHDQLKPAAVPMIIIILDPSYAGLLIMEVYV